MTQSALQAGRKNREEDAESFKPTVGLCSVIELIFLTSWDKRKCLVLEFLRPAVLMILYAV